MSEELAKVPFVTFYSFKGGVGRSMALINTAGILAGQRGFRVLVIDIDLEAPGLSYLDPSAPDESPSLQRELPFESGFVDLLIDAKLRGEEADLFKLTPEALAEKYTKGITIPAESCEFSDGTLSVMPAGKLDATYAFRLNALNIGELYRSGIGEPLIRAFKKKIAESGLYDYVLVDSRTGLSDEAGMCTRDLADHLMILSGLNRQNVQGTSEFLRAIRTATESKKTLQVILSPVPNGEDKLADERERAAENAFSQAWKAKIDLSLQIPYHPQLALTEEPHIFRRRKGYLFESYRAIERSMLDTLGHTAHAYFRETQELLRKKDYKTALVALQRMIRIDPGVKMLSRLANEFAFPEGFRLKTDEKIVSEPITLKNLAKTKEGKAILEFFVKWLPANENEWLIPALARKLSTVSPELANKLFIRLVEANPKSSDIITEYADFLWDKTDDLRGAETNFKRAVEIDPNDANAARSYARFLANSLKDLIGAEHFYRQALEIVPGSMNDLADYGQVLAAAGRFEEAESKLLQAFDLLPKSKKEEKGNAAELCFTLWIVARMQGHDGRRWEQHFKSLITEDFKRHLWNFDGMLEKARGILSEVEFIYAQALAAAFLDKSKVKALKSIPRWIELEELPLSYQKTNSHRRKGNK